MTERAHLKGIIKYKSFSYDEIFLGDVYFEFLLDDNYWVIS